MKKIIYIFFATLLTFSLSSCLDGEEFDSPQLNTEIDFDVTPSQTDVTLTLDREGDVAFTLSWLELDYGFQNAIPSFEVYINGVFFEAVNSYSFSPNTKSVNNFLLGEELVEPGQPSPVKVQVFAALGETNTPSNVLDMNITTYTSVFGPEELYAVGAALPTGWDWANYLSFQRSSSEAIRSVVYLDASKGAEATFRFFTIATAWDSGQNYPYFIDNGWEIDDKFENAMDGDQNFLFTGTSGVYILELNYKTKQIILSDEVPEQFYGVGSGLPEAGWGWDTPIDILSSPNGSQGINDGVYIATTEFSGEGENAFRFFTIDGDWGSGKNYPYFEERGWEIDKKLINAQDGDSNFKLDAPAGVYTLTINYNTKEIILEE